MRVLLHGADGWISVPVLVAVGFVYVWAVSRILSREPSEEEPARRVAERKAA